MAVAEYLNSPEKRALDLVVVGMLGETALRYGAVTAAALFVCNGKSPLFTQKRSGMGHEYFSIRKLRTLHEDERELRLGRSIRAIGLDELPQFYNVLTGDMSVVGYRPLLDEDIEVTVKHVDNTNLTDRWLQNRAECKPGLIGPAQLMPVRSDEGSSEHCIDIVTQECAYMEGASLGADVRMILSTPRTLILGHNSASARAT